MNKVRNLVGGVLLAISFASLNASALDYGTAGPEMRAMQSVTACCYVYLAGRWWCIQC